MFFDLFRHEPNLPECWDNRHLWVAQSMTVSILASDEDFANHLDQKDRLLEKLQREIEQFSDLPQNQYLFRGKKFKEDVGRGLVEYLSSEIDHMASFLRNRPSLPPRPRKNVLIETLNNDPGFSRFIKESRPSGGER